MLLWTFLYIRLAVNVTVDIPVYPSPSCSPTVKQFSSRRKRPTYEVSSVWSSGAGTFFRSLVWRLFSVLSKHPTRVRGTPCLPSAEMWRARRETGRSHLLLAPRLRMCGGTPPPFRTLSLCGLTCAKTSLFEVSVALRLMLWSCRL